MQTSNDDKRAAKPLRLTLGRAAEVFVAHDLRIRDKPEWLEPFDNTGLVVTADADDDERKARIYQVFVRDFPAGVVELGPNLPPGAAARRVSMYTVFVRPR